MRLLKLMSGLFLFFSALSVEAKPIKMDLATWTTLQDNVLKIEQVEKLLGKNKSLRKEGDMLILTYEVFVAKNKTCNLRIPFFFHNDNYVTNHEPENAPESMNFIPTKGKDSGWCQEMFIRSVM